MTINWDALVKTYDVRGLVGTALTTEIVTALAAGFVDELEAAGQDVIVGHDMRDSSPEFAEAFAIGAQARGANVISIGLCSTDESYFASGIFNAPAAMFRKPQPGCLQRHQVFTSRRSRHQPRHRIGRHP